MSCKYRLGFADTTMSDLQQLSSEISDVYPDLNLAVVVSIHKNQKLLMKQVSQPLSPFTPAYPDNKGMFYHLIVLSSQTLFHSCK